jgi:3',5'-cyclic AMP phosphodiesterase CpdA
VYSVGGAIIINNSFVNTFVLDGVDDAFHLRTEGHIRARGTYDNHQFDWTAYFFLNRFDKAYATGPLPPFVLRQYSYTSPTLDHFDHVRRIGALAAGEQDIAQPGDKTISKP